MKSVIECIGLYTQEVCFYCLLVLMPMLVSVDCLAQQKGDGDLSGRYKAPITVFLNASLAYIPHPARLRAFLLIRQAFLDIGYAVEFDYLPPQRLIENVGIGKIDVACMRSAGLESNNKNILRVPVSVHQLKLFAYVLSSKVPNTGLWKDMPINTVGLLHGAQNAKSYIPEELMQKRIVRTPDRLTGAKMVGAGRLDVVVFPEIIFHAYDSVESAVLSRLVKLEPELGSIETYCFISAKRRDLFDPLTAALASLKDRLPERFDDSLYPMLISE